TASNDDLADAIQLARNEACRGPVAALAEVQRLLFGGSGRTFVGRYRVAERLGTGGQGTVWIAHDPQLGRDVAIKLINVGYRAPQSAQSRLLREARALARVSHPNVLEVLDVGVHEGHLFMVTELVRGADMRRWLDARPRSWRERLAVIRGVASGLAAVHRLGLLHRDVKPANVLVTSDGRALLGDFGLARPWTREPSSESVEVTPAPVAPEGSATLPTAWVGTPAYLAPEQHVGAPANESTDRYALCVTAWEVLFGARPFDGKTMAELALAKQRARTIAPRGTDVPLRLVNVLRRGMQADPARRHASTPALIAALDRAVVSRRSRGIAMAGALVAAVLALPTTLAAVASEDLCADARDLWATTWQPVDTTAAASDIAMRVDEYMAAMGSDWTAQSCDVAQRLVADGDDVRAAAELDCLVALREDLRDAIAIHGDAGEQGMRDVLRSLADAGRPADCRDAVHRPPPAQEHAEAVAEARQRLAGARAMGRAGDSAGAFAAVTAASTIAERVEFVPLDAEVELARGRLLFEDVDEAERAFNRAYTLGIGSHHDVIAIEAALELAHVRAARHDDPEGARRWLRQASSRLPSIAGTRKHELLAARLDALRGKIAGVSGDWRSAATHAAAAIARLEAIDGAESGLAIATAYAAEAAQQLDRADDAEQLFARSLLHHERAFGGEHPNTAVALANLANALVANHRPAEAVPLLRRAISIREAALGPRSLESAPAWQTLANALRDTGDAEGAVVAADRAVTIFREILGAPHQRLARALWARGDAAYGQRDWDGAQRRYREAADQFEALDLPGELAWMQHKLGLALARLDRRAEATSAHERGLALREELFGANDLEIVKSVLPLAAAAEARGQLRAALAHARRGEVIARRHDVWRLLALALQRRARIERRLASPEAARESLREAIELFATHAEPASVSALSLELARLEHDAGDVNAEIAAYERALAGSTATLDPETRDFMVLFALAPDEPATRDSIARDLARARRGT
ncbi:MAG TPA: serine/threonine-protein kinase, partial [Nannocystaceae bacterium]|nr:serine/threonine-protein kinase [Nannocystaceae bacterium]